MNLSTVQNKMATMINQIIASKVSATADNYDQILNSVIKNGKVSGGSTHRKTRRPNIIKHNKKRTITRKKGRHLNTLDNHNHNHNH
jgi:hypothetical protein